LISWLLSLSLLSTRGRSAPFPTLEQTAALKSELAKQIRVDLLEQYVGGLRTRYGYNINEKLLKQALGPQTEQPQDTSDD